MQLTKDVFAHEYYKNFTFKEGRTPIDARVVLGAVIKGNPYLQYFIGYKGFTNVPAFDPSLFVSIRKRMGEDLFDSMTGCLMIPPLQCQMFRPPLVKSLLFMANCRL